MARTASRKSSPKQTGKTLGRLPVWDLSDLYPAPDSKALKSDLDAVEKKASAFHKKYATKVSGLSGAALGAAVAAYEGIERDAAEVSIPCRVRIDTQHARRALAVHLPSGDTM